MDERRLRELVEGLVAGDVQPDDRQIGRPRLARDRAGIAAAGMPLFAMGINPNSPASSGPSPPAARKSR